MTAPALALVNRARRVSRPTGHATDAALRRSADGATTRRTVARIVASFDAATPAMVASGAAWYPEAYGVCVSLAAQHGVSVETVAAVLAHLSARTPWARNVAGTAHLLATGGGKLAGILSTNHARALVAYHSPDPLATLNGPKVRAFAHNILGDHETVVTIDVWAARVALGTDTATALDTIIGRAGVYAALAECYRRAAGKRGVSPATMQAVTWVVARNGRAA